MVLVDHRCQLRVASCYWLIVIVNCESRCVQLLRPRLCRHCHRSSIAPRKLAIASGQVDCCVESSITQYVTVHIASTQIADDCTCELLAGCVAEALAGVVCDVAHSCKGTLEHPNHTLRWIAW